MRPALALLVVMLVTACSIGPTGPFKVTAAHLDSSHTCPEGSSNSPYQGHAMLDADNPTSKDVNISKVSAVITVVATHGNWLNKVGDKFDAVISSFSPKAVKAGSKTTVKVNIDLVCTNTSTGGNSSNYGDYTAEFTVATSAGTFKAKSQNNTRISAP